MCVIHLLSTLRILRRPPDDEHRDIHTLATRAEGLSSLPYLFCNIRSSFGSTVYYPCTSIRKTRGSFSLSYLDLQFGLYSVNTFSTSGVFVRSKGTKPSPVRVFDSAKTWWGVDLKASRTAEPRTPEAPECIEYNRG